MGTKGLTVMRQMARLETNKKMDLAVRVKDSGTGYIMKANKLFELPVETRRLIDPSLIEVRTPLGILMRPDVILLTPEEIDRQAKAIDTAFEAANPRQNQAIFPPMLDVKGQTYKRIMIGELTRIEAAQFLKPEEISGHNANELQSRLREPSSASLIYTNGTDARKYIEAANEKGRKFRFMTDAEFDALSAEEKSQLKGDNWFSVETERGSGKFYWRSLRNSYRYNYDHPVNRFRDNVVRLVED